MGRNATPIGAGGTRRSGIPGPLLETDAGTHRTQNPHLPHSTWSRVGHGPPLGDNPWCQTRSACAPARANAPPRGRGRRDRRRPHCDACPLAVRRFPPLYRALPSRVAVVVIGISNQTPGQRASGINSTAKLLSQPWAKLGRVPFKQPASTNAKRLAASQGFSMIGPGGREGSSARNAVIGTMVMSGKWILTCSTLAQSRAPGMRRSTNATDGRPPTRSS